MVALLNVGELRRALRGVPDCFEVVVRASEEHDEGGDEFVMAGAYDAKVEAPSCGDDDEPAAFVIDANELEAEEQRERKGRKSSSVVDDPLKRRLDRAHLRLVK